MPKQFLQNCFSFTKKERTGITVLIILICIFIALPFLYPIVFPPKKPPADLYTAEINLLKKQETAKSGYKQPEPYDAAEYANEYQNAKQEFNGKMFYFDPNTASANDWQQLGIRPKTIQTISNFLSKGGKFFRPEDIGKIWGLHKSDIDRLVPYVRIEKQFYRNDVPESFSKAAPADKKTYATPLVDINSADSIAFIALPGIGPKLSQRIISFRNKLGGFYTIDQVGETFGLPDSVFQKIKNRLVISNSAVVQININTASADEMKVHPYLHYTIANAIVQYRSQHGKFASLGDLKKIMMISEELYQKIVPYLKLGG